MSEVSCSRCGGSGREPDVSLFASRVSTSDSVVMIDWNESGDFADFWRDYPRKQAKATAVKSWARMSHVERVAAIDALPSHVAMWDREGRGTRTIPMATTWLNQRRWEDDLSEYRDESAPRKVMPGRGGIVAALANRNVTAIDSRRGEIGDGR